MILCSCWLVSCQSAAEQDTSVQSEENSTEDVEADHEGFISIFDGNSLEGWEGDPKLWRAENGVLIGEIKPDNLIENNSFIIWQGDELQDFEFKTEFRISQSGNSGINYRSERIDTLPYALRGYQADIDGKHTYTGQNYEEKKRTTLAYRGQKTTVNSQQNPEEANSLRANVERNAWLPTEVKEQIGGNEELKNHIREGWNECHLVIKGNKLQHYVNGVLMSEVTDNDTVNRNMSGLLGVQVHVGPPMKVEYRNIRLKKL